MAAFRIRAWCDEHGLVGDYLIDAESTMDARRQAVKAFRADCIDAAAVDVPGDTDVYTCEATWPSERRS